MSELALKCETNCAILKQNQTAKLLIGFKLAYSCCLSLKGSPDFQYFVQKCFALTQKCYEQEIFAEF